MFAALIAALAAASCGATRAENGGGFVAYSECRDDDVSVSLRRPDVAGPELLATAATIDPRSVRIGAWSAFWKDDGSWREASFAGPPPARLLSGRESRAGFAPLDSYRLRAGHLRLVYHTGSSDTTLLEVPRRRRGGTLEIDVVTSGTYDEALAYHCVSVPVVRHGLRRVVERHSGRRVKRVGRPGRAERRRLSSWCRRPVPAP